MADVAWQLSQAHAWMHALFHAVYLSSSLSFMIFLVVWRASEGVTREVGGGPNPPHCVKVAEVHCATGAPCGLTFPSCCTPTSCLSRPRAGPLPSHPVCAAAAGLLSRRSPSLQASARRRPSTSVPMTPAGALRA